MAMLLRFPILPMFVRMEQLTTQPATITTSVSTEELSPTATQHPVASTVAPTQTAAQRLAANMEVPTQTATPSPHSARVLLRASRIQ